VVAVSLGKAVEAFAEGLVINLLPKGQQPCRRRSFRQARSVQ
jgi:hypothetical protein